MGICYIVLAKQIIERALGIAMSFYNGSAKETEEFEDEFSGTA